MTRACRHLLCLCLAAATATCKKQPPAAPQPTAAPQPAQELRPPAEVRTQASTLTTELRIEYALNRLGADTVYLRSYNGGLVGPTLRLRPGDTLELTLRNNLPGPGESGGHHAAKATATYNEPHAFNNTNFHSHGLWVDPEGSAQTGWGDNVLLDIKPGESAHYRIHLPKDHPPGTHWYHAHRHGSVALQVSSGMAGALIIEGGLDDVPEIRAAREQVMMFQQIAYDSRDCGDALPAAQRDRGVGCIESYDNFDVGDWQKLGRHTTINGQLQPVLTLRPGEVQRWRLIHGGVRESLHLAIVREDDKGHLSPALPRTASGRLDVKALIKAGLRFEPLHVLAEDGIAYGRMDERTSLKLESGYRADVLVKLDEPGSYQLVDLPSSPIEALHPMAEELAELARVVVSGPPMNMPLPAAASLTPLAPYAHVEDREITGCQKVEFDAGPHKYTINGRAFHDDAPPCQLPLGEAQEWRLSAKAANHPFHIHVNPFEVLREEGTPVWKDTFLVRSDGDTQVIRTRYRRFTGTFVLHCHILDHEDQGMMELVRVMASPPAIGAAGSGCVPCEKRQRLLPLRRGR